MFRLVLAICILIGYTSGLGFFYLGVLTASIGFWPAVLGSFFIWAYAIYTGFLFLNVCSAEPLGTNIPSLSSKYFGPFGKVASISIFFILNYGYCTLYFIFGSSVIFGMLEPWIGVISDYQMYLILFLFFSFVLCLGTFICSSINFLFISGLLASLFLFFSYGELSPHHGLMFSNWIYLLLGLPGLYDILFFHSTIPFIFTLLKGNLKLTKTAIWIGTLVSLLLYWLWIWIIITPKTELGFIQAFENYDSFFKDLEIFYSQYVSRKGLEWIPVFGISAGLLSTGLSFFHFYSDLFQNIRLKSRWLKRAGISVFIALPPAIISLLPNSLVRRTINIFQGFMEIALGAAIPIILFWSMRYIRNISICDKFYYKKRNLVFVAILTAFFFYIEGVSILKFIVW